MADRSVRVRLEAKVDGYVAGIRTAVKATEDFEKRASGYVDKHAQSINDMSNTMLGAGAVLTAFSAIAIKSAADFDEAMSSVQAATMAPAGEMEKLRQIAIETGASTKYSATEAAGAIEQLAKAGVSTADILSGGLHGALDLAASDNIEVGEAAEIAASAMTQFGLSGQDVTHIADLLAAGAGKAQGGVMDLGQALQQAGLVSSQFGLSIEETVGGLTAFAAAGVTGSDAGTSFKSMLQRLSNPTGEASEKLKELGINTYDANGQFVGLAEFAGQLQTAMADLSPEARNAAMSVIFGADAVRAANVLYAEGESGIRDWITAVDDQGFAAEQARIRMDNLKGDFEELKGALETAFISAGTDASNGLRPVVQAVTDVVNAFNNLPSSAQSVLGYGSGVLGLSLLAVGGMGKLVTSVNDTRNAMLDLGLEVDKTSGKLKLLGIGSAVTLAITGLAAAVTYFVGESAKAQASADSLASTFDELTGAATASTDTMIIEQINEQVDATDWGKLRDLGISYSEVVEAVKGGEEGFRDFNARTAELKQGLDTSTKAGREQRNALIELEQVVAETGVAYTTAAEQQAELARGQEEVGATAETTAAQQEVLNGAIEATGVGLEGVVEDMQTFLELLFATGLATMSARDAQAAYHESVDGVGSTIDDLIEKHGGLGAALNEAKTDFDLTTEAGREANGAFQEVAQSGFDVASSMAEAGASQDDIQGKLNGTYEDLIAAAGQFGITGQAAEDLAREVLGIPDGVDIETWMSDEAERQAENTKTAVEGIDRDVRVTTTFTTIGDVPAVLFNGGSGRPGGMTATAEANGGVLEFYANGGMRENHVAQIAPAGAMRLWAEPETGGEAYIPLASAKRARSERILAEVASRFGMGLQKFDNGGMVLPMATGGVTYPSDTSITHQYTFNNYNTDAVRAVREQMAQFGQKVDAMPVGVPG